MVSKKVKKQKNKDAEDYVRVDAYMIPAPQAEMYRVLREAVAEDLIEEVSKQYPEVKRMTDEDEGEGIVAFTETSQEALRIYLNPTNISAAQKARDKDQMDKFIEHYFN